MEYFYNSTCVCDNSCVMVIRYYLAARSLAHRHCNFRVGHKCVRNCDPNLLFYNSNSTSRCGTSRGTVPQLVRSRNNGISFGQSFAFSSFSFGVDRAYEKNREPRRAILRLATNQKPSRFKADAFSTFLFRLRAVPCNGRTWFLASPFVSPRRLGVVFLTITCSFMSPIIASLKQISDLARRPENRVRQRHFPFRSFCETFLYAVRSKESKSRYFNTISLTFHVDKCYTLICLE